MSEVDAIVVLTVGRSRATTHFHLKWAKTLGERVLVLASCRNESGVAMIQKQRQSTKNEWNFLRILDKLIRLQTKYHKKSLNIPQPILGFKRRSFLPVEKRVSIAMFTNLSHQPDCPKSRNCYRNRNSWIQQRLQPRIG